MRLLVVYANYVHEARALALRSQATDVTVIGTGKKEKKPNSELVALLAANPGIEVAFVSIQKEFVNVCRREFGCVVACSCSSIVGSADLAAWLKPPTAGVDDVVLSPTQCLRAAADAQSQFVVAEGAIRHADDITEERFPFVNYAAKALADYAEHPHIPGGQLRLFFKDRKVEYVGSGGNVYAKVTIRRGGKTVEKITSSHLKIGDHTSAENAPRIYFLSYEGFVILLRCGPHPPPGTFTIEVDLP